VLVQSRNAAEQPEQSVSRIVGTLCSWRRHIHAV
jgi:hypothetical protein